MATQEGAEQYGGQYATGNISSEQMDKLDARAAKADVTEGGPPAVHGEPDEVLRQAPVELPG